MVDPTSELNENVDEADAPDCEICGTPIVGDPGHRVITWVEDGTVRTVHFCSDACRSDWDRE